MKGARQVKEGKLANSAIVGDNVSMLAVNTRGSYNMKSVSLTSNCI